MIGFRSQQSGSALSESSVSNSNVRGFLGKDWDFWLMRTALFGASVAICYAWRPFNLHALPAAGLGFFIAMVILLAE